MTFVSFSQDFSNILISYLDLNPLCFQAYKEKAWT